MCTGAGTGTSTGAGAGGGADGGGGDSGGAGGLSVESIRQLIISQTKADQQRALVLVRHLDVGNALPLLLLCVAKSKNEFVRSSAAVALGHLEFDSARDVEMELRTKCVDKLVALLLGDEDYGVRSGAAAGLGYSARHNGDEEGVILDALTRAVFEDTEWQVRFSALAALGDVRDKRAIPILLPALQDTNDLLVQAAVGALGNIGDASVVPRLLSLLGSSDMMTRQRLAQALGEIKDVRSEPAVLDALRTLARDRYMAVRDAARNSLAQFGCADPAPTKNPPPSDDDLLQREVQSLLKGDESGNADVIAGDAFRRRLERSFDKECAEGAASETPLTRTRSDSDSTAYVNASELSDAEFDAAVADLRTGDVGKQTLALITLRRGCPARVRSAVLDAGLLDPRRAAVRVRSLAVRLVARAQDMHTVLHTLAGDPEENVRSACCDAAAEAGGGPLAVRACIRSFQEDQHWLVRISAAIALGTIGKGDVAVEDALIAALKPGGVSGDLPAPQESVVRRHAIIALGFLGSTRCFPALRDLVYNQNTEQPVRLRIASALRGIRSVDSIPLLKTLAADEHPEVAEMAQGSLDTLAQLGFA